MYTADMARQESQDDLDRRIAMAVRARDAGPNATYMRVYIEDSWLDNLEHELEIRGFKNIELPDIIIKGDVYFEW